MVREGSLVVIVVLIRVLCACGGPSGMPDGGGIDAPLRDDVGMDAPRPDDVGRDTPTSLPDAVDGGESCLGVPDGFTECVVDSRSCCGGVWHHYWDGACLPGMDAGLGRDAGSPCAVEPEAIGCPCTTEGAVACPLYRYRRLCTGGSWVEDRGIVCCSGIL